MSASASAPNLRQRRTVKDTNGDEVSLNSQTSYRLLVSRRQPRFDVDTLPEDMLRVYRQLEAKHGEEYGLLFVFNMRTAIELHRAWHMTLLTSKILQQVKDKFGLRMTWNLGVIRIIFRVEDGGFELHRKVPYDYDSENQDIYFRIAEALVEGRINIHEALIYQTETKEGKHTAKSGLFLRDFPGRLVLYPLEAATCAVIFFGGDWRDAGVAAITGLASGLVEYALSYIAGEAKILIDILVGITTGIIGGLFFRYDGEQYCLASIFLGTLYWFFYGTAFVVGIIEIIAGELETGVTRFIAVSVKTFVLSMGASIGLSIVLEQDTSVAWIDQSQNCGNIDLNEQWWRIPLYLLCSASALGQYRMPIVRYWRALAVQLAGYEVQYQAQRFYNDRHSTDNIDTAISNILGGIACVVSACLILYFFDIVRRIYYSRLLQRGHVEKSKIGDAIYAFVVFNIKMVNHLGIGRKSDMEALAMSDKIRQLNRELLDPHNPREDIQLTEREESLLIESLVGAETFNIWAIIMPALYQLVPGSIIARLWFNSIFPPPLLEQEATIPGTNLTYTTFAVNQDADNVFSNLMVISTSLGLGIILGFGVVRLGTFVLQSTFRCLDPASSEDMTESERNRVQDRVTGMLVVPDEDFSDRKSTFLENIPEGVEDEEQAAAPNGDSTMFSTKDDSRETA